MPAKMVLYRGAGHGDVLCLTSAIPGLRKKYPNLDLDFVTGVNFSDMVWYDPRLHSVYEIENFNQFPYKIQKIFKPDHGTQWDAPIPVVQCRMLDVPFSPPRYYFKDGELDNVDEHDIAVVVHATDQRRCYQSLNDAVEILQEEYDVIQIDHGPHIARNHPDLSIREAVATMARAKMVLTVDTGFMHAAVALDLNALIVFTITDTRVQYIGNCSHMKYPDVEDIVDHVRKKL